MKKMGEKILALTLFMLVLCVVLSSSGAKSTNELVEGTPMPIDIAEDLLVNMNLIFSNVPVVQHVVNVSLIIEPEIEVPDAEICILLPREFSLVKGNLQWKGDLLKNRIMQLEISVMAEKIGDYSLEAIAIVKPSNGYPKKISSTRIYTSVVEREDDFKPILLEDMTQQEVINLNTNETIAIENVAPSSPGTITVYGYWYYYDQSSNLKPCRYARVELWDGDFPVDVKLATAYCQSNGYYQFPAINNDDGSLQDGYDVYVKVFCDSDFEVYVTDGSDGTWWAQTDKHDNAPDGMHNMGSYTITGSNRGSWGIYDNVIDEFWWLMNRVGWHRSEVQVRWPVETWPHSHGNRIDVPSGWEWDRMMALHEYAHCIHYEARGGSWPSGSGPDPHYIYSESSGGFAITEGWAEFMQCAVDNRGDYGFGTGQSIEANTWADTIDSGDWDGNIVEGAVASIFWDIFDGTSSSDESWGDYINQEFSKLWNVFLNDDPNDIQTNFWNGWQSRYGVSFNEWAVFYGSRINKDTTPPNQPTGFTSSHTPNVWSSDNTIDITWMGASDDLSGVWGYSYVWVNSPTQPDTSRDTTSNSFTSPPLSNGDWYCCIRTQDKAENWYPGHSWNTYPFKIDTTPPNNPTSYSSNPPVNVWSSDNTLDISWSGASDSHSGVHGYSYIFDQSPSTIPDTSEDTTGTSLTGVYLSDGSNWYFHVRARDNAGNWASGVYHVGPFKIDTTAPSNPASYSSSHTANSWSNDNTVDVTWYGASDGSGSGVYGFSYTWSTSPELPDTSVDTTGASVTSPSLSDGWWYLNIRTRDNAGNWNGGYVYCGPFGIDTDTPSNPNSYSSSHTVNVWSTDNTVDITWSGASDSLSGVYGYSFVWDQSSTTLPDTTVDTTGTSTTSSPLSDGNWYFHVRARDNAGNWASGAYHVGPFKIDTVAPSTPSPDDGVSGWSKVNTPTFSWSASSDSGSGVKGYWWKVDGGSETWTISTSVTLSPESDGSHTFYVRAEDNAGNKGNYGQHGFQIDTIAPTGSITINNGAAYTNSTSVTLTLTYSDAGSGVDKVRYSNEGIWDTEPWEDPSSTKTWTLTSGDGTKTVYYQVEDKVGLTSPTFSSTIILDTTAPVVVITYPTNGAYVDSVIIVWVNGTLTELNKGGAQPLINDTRFGPAFWNGTHFGFQNTTAAIPDGILSLRVNFTDLAGNTGQAAVWFTVDNKPPVVTITSPIGVSYVRATVWINATVVEANQFEYEIRINGTTVHTGSGQVSWQWGTTLYADGIYIVNVTSTDVAGNVGSQAVTVTVDNTPPVKTVVSPAPGFYLNYNTVWINETLSDTTSGINASTITMTLNGTAVSPTYDPSTGKLSYHATALADYNWTMVVSVKDLAGNLATNSFWFIVDTTAPVVAITYPTEGAYLDSVAVIWVNGTVTELNKGSLQPQINSSAFFLIVWNSTAGTFAFGNIAAVPDGLISLKVTFTDLAGKTGYDTVYFTVDTVPPGVSITYPTQGANVTISQTVWINGTVTELNKATLTPSINETRFVLTYMNSATGFFAFSNNTALPEGLISVKVNFTDLAGNTGQNTVTFTLTLIPPHLRLERVTSWYWFSNTTTITSVVGGDVDGDGSSEIVTGGYFFDGSRKVALLHVWSGSGLTVERAVAWFWSGDTEVTSIAVGDVDGDGAVEIVTGGCYFDGVREVAQLHVWNGATLAVKKVISWYWGADTSVQSVVIVDVDGDGQEIVTGGCYFDGVRKVALLHVWSGASLAVKKVISWYWGGDTEVTSVAFGDVDGDGGIEIVTGGYYFDGVRRVAQLHVWNGSTLAVEKVQNWYWGGDTEVFSVLVGDADGDGSTEIVTGGYYFDGTRKVALLHVWSGSSLSVENAVQWFWSGDTEVMSVAAGDVDGDGQTEIVTGGYYFDGVKQVAQLHVWNGNSLAVENVIAWYWSGSTSVRSLWVDDVDGDTQREIVAGGYFTYASHLNAQLTVWAMT